MLKIQKTVMAAILLLLFPLSSFALVLNGQIVNIDGDNAGGVNDLSISWVEFTLAEQGAVSVSLDAGFRPQLMLLEKNKGEGISSFVGVASGTTTLTYDASSEHDYMLAIGQMIFTRDHALVGYRDQSSLSGVGNWQATLSDNIIVTQVPVPAALPLFFSALCGLVAIRRKQS